MAATLTAYAIAQGYALSVLATGFYAPAGSPTLVDAQGATRLPDGGFVVAATDATNRARYGVYRFPTVTQGQDLTAATLSLMPGTAYANSAQIICCNNVIYAGGLQGASLGTVWKTTDFSVYSIYQTTGTGTAATVAGLVADTRQNYLYSSSTAQGAIRRHDLNTNTVSVLYQASITPQGIALSYDGLTLYVARRAAIDIINTATGTKTGQVTTPGFVSYNVMIMDGAKAGKLIVGGNVTVGSGPTTLYELDIATGAYQAIVTGLGSVGTGNITLFDKNLIAVPTVGSLTLLAVPPNSTVCFGSCYDGYGNNGGGFDPVPDPQPPADWNTPDLPPNNWSGNNSSVSCGWQTPNKPTCGWNTPDSTC